MAELKKGITRETCTSTQINTAGDIAMSRKPLFFYQEQYIKIILASMQKNRTGCAGVIDESGRLIGMLTEREILRRIFALLADPTIHHANIGKHVDDMTVREVMITQPHTLDADQDIEEVLGIMTELGFRFMPVVHHQNPEKLIGFVDEREVAIHVKNRLDNLKKEAAEKGHLLQELLRESYGAVGFAGPAN